MNILQLKDKLEHETKELLHLTEKRQINGERKSVDIKCFFPRHLILYGSLAGLHLAEFPASY